MVIMGTSAPVVLEDEVEPAPPCTESCDDWVVIGRRHSALKCDNKWDLIGR